MSRGFFIISLAAATCIASYGEDILLKNLNVTADLTRQTIQSSGKYLGVSRIDRDTLSSMPSLNRGLTDLLKINSSVSFSKTQITSKNLGEIDPQDISINGAKFYQNNFMIDGLNINNDINPAIRTSDQRLNLIYPDFFGSISQGINLDSSLIDSITLHDSSVSARHGNFEGGVIDAKTIEPSRGGVHGRFSISHTSDKLTKFHIDDKELDEFINSHENNIQPKFRKYKGAFELNGYLTEDLGAVFNYSQTLSKIPVGVNPTYFSDKKDSYDSKRTQIRKNENFFLKFKWFATDRLTITPTLMYAPSTALYFNPAVKDSGQNIKSGGLSLSVDTDYDFDTLSLKQVFGYSSLQSSRDADKEYLIQWAPSNKRPWGRKDRLFGSGEGGYGDINQNQKTLSYRATLDFEPIKFSSVEHNFAAGVELKRQNGSFEVVKDFYSITGITELKGNEVCASDDKWCFMEKDIGGKNHYLRIWEIYSKGKISKSVNQLSAWLEDDINIGSVWLRPGVRFDADSYMSKNSIAPRFSSKYDIFGDGSSNFMFGLNRYYGRNSFAYSLKDGKESLKTRFSRRNKGAYSEWFEDKVLNEKQQKSKYMFRKLRIPYNDEVVVGFNQKVLNFDILLKYIKRNAKDQVTISTAKKEGLEFDKTQYSDSVKIYTNNGRSETDIYTITIKNINAYEIASIRHKFELGFSYEDKKTTAPTYDDEVDFDEYIKLDGKYIKVADRPANNFYSKWALNLYTISEIPQLNMKWGNTFSFKDGSKDFVKVGTERYQGKAINVLETMKFKDQFNWDTKFAFEWAMAKNSKLFANIDILNVLNQKNAVSARNAVVSKGSSIARVNKTTYQAGRQFWFEIGYKW